MSDLILGGHDPLDSLVFLQQESSHNSSLDTSPTGATTIGPADRTLSLLGILVSGICHALDSEEAALAIGADGSLGLLLDDLGHEATTRGLDGCRATGFGGVMPSYKCDTFIRHGSI